MARITPMSTINPRQLIDAEQAAIDAYTRAYGPMPVSQPDGTHIQLCWYGRIDRAFLALSNAKGTDREPLIKDAVQSLINQSRQRQIDANEAATEYERLCAESKVNSKDIVPKECDCVFCRGHNLEHGVTVARVDMAVHVSNLLLSAPGKLPAIVAAVEASRAGNQEATVSLRKALDGMAAAMRRYYQLCEKNGLEPDWRIY